MPAIPLQPHLVRHGCVAWVTPRGELDLAAQPMFDLVLREASDAAATAVVALDLRELTFMDAVGLRSILAAQARSEEQHWTLIILRGVPAVQLVFTASGTADRLHMSPTCPRDDAW
jgi:anti-anti-sigma factor